MAFEVRVEQDSVWNGRRITTVVATYPRCIHAELMTHRAFCRNAASSRAIPVRKMLQQIKDDPFIPMRWGMNQSGMQQGAVLDADGAQMAEDVWLCARDQAVHYVEQLLELNLHKSLPNRILEPWSWITTVVTATEWANFFRLRRHKDAEVHFQKLAVMLYDEMKASAPVERVAHFPFLDAEEHEQATWAHRTDNYEEEHRWAMISSARCARVSYLTLDGRKSVEDDLKLADRLVQGSGFGHWSPMEHAAFGKDREFRDDFIGPYRGWYSFRSTCPGENLVGHLAEYEEALTEHPELMI
jgi:hypothetical protein